MLNASLLSSFIPLKFYTASIKASTVQFNAFASFTTVCFSSIYILLILFILLDCSHCDI